MLSLLNSIDQVIVFVPLVSTGMVNAMELEAPPAASGTCSDQLLDASSQVYETEAWTQ